MRWTFMKWPRYGHLTWNVLVSPWNTVSTWNCRSVMNRIFIVAAAQADLIISPILDIFYQSWLSEWSFSSSVVLLDIVIDSMNSSLILVVVAGVLGGLVIILGSIYAYIFCVKLKPRRRTDKDHRLPHYHTESAHTSHGGEGSSTMIKTHPFFIMHYMNKLKHTDPEAASHSATARRHWCTKSFLGSNSLALLAVLLDI